MLAAVENQTKAEGELTSLFASTVKLNLRVAGGPALSTPAAGAWVVRGST
jgi:hypothetical protein